MPTSCPAARAAGQRHSGKSTDLEDRVAGSHLEQLRVRSIGSDTVEEHAHLELPPLQVSAQDLRLLTISQFGGSELLGLPAHPQLAAASGAQVPHPLRLATRRDQVAAPVAGQDVDRSGPPLNASPAAHV